MKGLCKTISLFLIVVMLFVPTLAFAQGDATRGRADGERDAQKNTSKPVWILVGCLTSGISYIYPLVMTAAVPQAAMVGKSSEYVANYTDAYNAQRKKIMQSGSCIGGLISVGCCILYYVVVIALITSEAETIY